MPWHVRLEHFGLAVGMVLVLVGIGLVIMHYGFRHPPRPPSD